MKQKKKWTVKNIVGIICFVTLLFSIGFSICKIFGAPADPAEAQPHERLKSDYVLMLAQCTLGLHRALFAERHRAAFQIDIPNYLEVFYFVFLYCAIYLGEVRNFFFIIPCWDTILHTFSGSRCWAFSGSRSWTS